MQTNLREAKLLRLQILPEVPGFMSTNQLDSQTGVVSIAIMRNILGNALGLQCLNHRKALWKLAKQTSRITNPQDLKPKTKHQRTLKTNSPQDVYLQKTNTENNPVVAHWEVEPPWGNTGRLQLQTSMAAPSSQSFQKNNTKMVVRMFELFELFVHPAWCGFVPQKSPHISESSLRTTFSPAAHHLSTSIVWCLFSRNGRVLCAVQTVAHRLTFLS